MAILQTMFAQSSGLVPGELHVIVNNLHIYDRHEEYIKNVLNNPEYETPKLWVNPEVKNFYDFTIDDFKLIDYQCTKVTTKFEVAE